MKYAAGTAARGGTARKAGLLYLGMGLVAPFNVVFVPRYFSVRDDAAATARRILEHEGLYRLGILSHLIVGALFLMLAVTLYQLLRDVDRPMAMLMVAFVATGIAVDMLNGLLLSAPLLWLQSADLRASFPATQLEALVSVSMRLRAFWINVTAAWWGLWLLPLAVLLARWGRVPRAITALTACAGFAYVVASVSAIIAPAYFRLVSRAALPLEAAGELALIAWLILRGTNDQTSTALSASPIT